MNNCQELIDLFLKTSNQQFEVKYNNYGNDGIGFFNNQTCFFDKHHLEQLKKSSRVDEIKTYHDKIFINCSVYVVVPVKQIYISK